MDRVCVPADCKIVDACVAAYGDMMHSKKPPCASRPSTGVVENTTLKVATECEWTPLVDDGQECFEQACGDFWYGDDPRQTSGIDFCPRCGLRIKIKVVNKEG